VYSTNVARVVLVVPCYNEEARLDVKAFASFALEGHFVDFRFVDDGSTDGTARVLESIAAQRGGVAVQRLDRNRGKAEAVRQGFVEALRASPDYVGYWDADLAAPLSELAEFVSLMEARRDLDVVLGSRVKLLGRTIERLAWRHYSGRVSATLVSLSLELPVYDTQCGHKLFRATPLLREVFAEPFLTKWVFDVEILARLLTMDPAGREHAARSIYELPLRQWVDVQGSKVRPTDFARSLGDLWTIRRAYPSSKRRIT
jgi:glycosyltransferase involved in cell wall biosynthesis